MAENDYNLYLKISRVLFSCTLKMVKHMSKHLIILDLIDFRVWGVFLVLAVKEKN